MKQLMLDFWKDNDSLHKSYLNPALGVFDFHKIKTSRILFWFWKELQRVQVIKNHGKANLLIEHY